MKRFTFDGKQHIVSDVVAHDIIAELSKPFDMFKPGNIIKVKGGDTKYLVCQTTDHAGRSFDHLLFQTTAYGAEGVPLVGMRAGNFAHTLRSQANCFELVTEAK